MRVAFVDAYPDRWPVAVMCRAIGLSERTVNCTVVPQRIAQVPDVHGHERALMWCCNMA